MKIINIYPSEKNKAYIEFMNEDKRFRLLSHSKFIIKYPDFKEEVDSIMKKERNEFTGR